MGTSFGEKLFGSAEKTGATTEDIGRARVRFRQYMDWASRGLFDVAGQSAKNRKKSAHKLFELQNIGDSKSQSVLGQGYGNAQDRMALTNVAMRNARLGLPTDDRYLGANRINLELGNLQGVKLPDLGFKKASPVPRPIEVYGGGDELDAWGI